MAVFCASSLLPAQNPPQLPPRNNYVWHVYVDPLHGDNTRATQCNPSTQGATGRRPLDFHPEPGNPNPKIGGLLQHAPYPFKTLTGSNGALAYIDACFFSPAGTNRLPWGHPQHQKWLRWVVVHCLPGLYGPVGGQLPPTDPVSRLPFNGEVWPAIVRDRVSIQGASALDTIFDARRQETAVLEVNEPYSTEPTVHSESFVDSVSIRGARATAGVPASSQAPTGAGAGIHIVIKPAASGFQALKSEVTITNCFIYDNSVGIAVNGWSPNDQLTLGQGALIVNNTIAWNACGVWQGRFPIGNSTGPNAHVTRYLNNIFDSGSPSGYIAGLSGFEGIESTQVQVLRLGGQLLQSTIDFNAWEYGAQGAFQYVNRGVAIAPNWPATPTATQSNSMIPPRVNIAPYTKPARSGALYINDILRTTPPAGTPAGYDYSHHDFRLAPTARTASGAMVANPLVNQGLEPFNMPPPNPPLWPIAFAAVAPTIAHAPGLPDNAEDCPVHGWDWDGDGFGNRRIVDRPGFIAGNVAFHPNPPPPDPPPMLLDYQSRIDLGADELDRLTIAGYVPSTRMFHAHPVPGQVPWFDQTLVLFFDLVGQAPSYQRPYFNVLVGGRLDATLPAMAYDWFQHKMAGADRETLGGVVQSEYTRIQPPFLMNADPGRGMILALTALESLPRALECDFGGTLLPDKHPRWLADPELQYFLPLPPNPTFVRDEYGGNPWHGHDGQVTLPLPPTQYDKTKDNPAVYHNVGADLHQLFSYTTTRVTDATMVPPGSLLAGMVFLDLNYAWGSQFGPWSPCAAPGGGIPGSHFTVDPAKGYGAASTGCPDRIPYFSVTDGLGVRWNCQGLDGTPTNLQTFLSIMTAVIGPQGGQAAQGSQTRRQPSPVIDGLLKTYSSDASAAFPSRVFRAEGWR